MNEFEYLTISKKSESAYQDKGSKFLAYAFPIKNRTSVKIALEEIQQLHPKARHFCYAYRLGIDNNDYRTNDDGEPSNSAGKPILGQIDSNRLTNTLIIVVRYFGGTKLGIPGLIKAYKESAAAAIKNNIIYKQEIRVYWRLLFTYAEMPTIMNILKRNKLTIESQDFQESCNLEISFPKKNETIITNLLAKQQNLKLEKQYES